MEDLDHVRASDEEVVAWCHRWRIACRTKGLGRERRISSTSNVLVKLNDQALVKFGSPVTASEATNQRYARELLHSVQDGITVPRVYRYIETSTASDRIGYLVMEYVAATPTSDLPIEQFNYCIERVADAVKTMWRTTRDKPGPVDGGESQGPMWAPDSCAYECFQSRKDLENWFNRALQKENKEMDLALVSLVFCHLDLAPRNILLTSDSTLYILDWANAGFYPRFFEMWALRLTTCQCSEFLTPLIKLLPQPTQMEKDMIFTLWQSYRLNMLHNWSNELRTVSVMGAK